MSTAATTGAGESNDAAPELSRCTAIDVLKAAGIVVVIWIHAFQRFGVPSAPLVERLAFLARFAVPAFFFASGFLSARGRRLSSREFIAHRLIRIVVPYLLASVLALACRRLLFAEDITLTGALVAVATGGAWGIYYFVPLLLGAVIVGQGLSRAPALAWPLFVVFLVTGLLSEMWPLWFGGLYWGTRNPLRWWGYFFAGWISAPYAARPGHVSTRRRMGTATFLVGAVLYTYYLVALPSSWSREGAALQYLTIYCNVTGLFLLTLGSGEAPITRWLSEATYPIYLYHYFAVAVVHRWVVWPWRTPLAFVSACALSLLVVGGGRWLLGRGARSIIG